MAPINVIDQLTEGGGRDPEQVNLDVVHRRLTINSSTGLEDMDSPFLESSDQESGGVRLDHKSSGKSAVSKKAEEDIQGSHKMVEHANEDGLIQDFDTIVVSKDLPTIEEIRARDMVADPEDLEGEDDGESKDLEALAAKSIKFLAKASGNVSISRPRYKIFRSGDQLPEDVVVAPKTRPALDSNNGPYKDWPMFNDSAMNIKKNDPASWPPKNVLLQDWHLWKILESGISKPNRHKFWPADFNTVGLPHPKRKPKGRAAKIQDPESHEWFYVLVASINGPYQLHGDEGGSEPYTFPKDEDAAKDLKSSRGSKCRIQIDYIPSDTELLHGVKVSRYSLNQVPASVVVATPKRRKSNQGASETAEDGLVAKAKKQTNAPSKKRLSASASKDKNTKAPFNQTPTKPQANPNTPKLAKMADTKAGAKRVSDTGGSEASKVLKTVEGTSAGTRKRAAKASAGSDSDDDDEPFVRIAPKPRSNNKRSTSTDSDRVPLPNSPDATTSFVLTLLQSPLEPQNVGKGRLSTPPAASRSESAVTPLVLSTSLSSSATETTTAKSKFPPLRMKARRAQMNEAKKPSNSAFWASEAANAFHTLRDGSAFIRDALNSITKAIYEAANAEDVDETEMLLSAAIERAQQTSADHTKFVLSAGKSMMYRANGRKAPEYEKLVQYLKQYKKPEIQGTDDFMKPLELPKERLPDISMFEVKAKTAAPPRRQPNAAVQQAMERLKKGGDGSESQEQEEIVD